MPENRVDIEGDSAGLRCGNDALELSGEVGGVLTLEFEKSGQPCGSNLLTVPANPAGVLTSAPSANPAPGSSPDLDAAELSFPFARPGPPLTKR